MKMFYTNIRVLLLTLTCLFAIHEGKAQYTATVLETGGYYAAATKDQSGNIYVVRWNSGAGKYEVAKYNNGDPANVSIVYTGLASGGFEFPWGLAVNSSGHVFVTNPEPDPVKWEILKLTKKPDNTYEKTVIQQGRYFSALTLDASNNLLSIEYDAGINKFKVVRYTAGAENGPGTPLYSNLSVPAARTSFPWGIVMDSYSNIYLLDFEENANGGLIKLTAPGYTTATTLTTGRYFGSIAIDGSNNIYLTESLNATSVARVMKYTNPAQPGTEIYSGLTINSFHPWGLTVMPSGDIYVGDGAAPGNGRFLKLSLPADVTAPTITSVTVPANGYYRAGNNLDFTVHFSEAVQVSPSFTGSLPITIGSTVVQASYVSGSNTNALLFRYTVQPGNMDMNGITPGASLSLNGGTIRDAAGNNAILALNGVGNTSGVFVNTSIPSVTLSTTAPAIVNGSFTVTITFSEAVTGFTMGDLVTTNAGLSGLSTADNTTYTVSVIPLADGPVTVSLPANRTQNIGGNGNAASNTLTVQADLTAPFITSVGVPANGYYKAGDNLDFTVHFNETVRILNTPFNGTLPITIGSTVVQATYVSGTNTNAFLFRYTVLDGQMDMDGITVGSSLTINSHVLIDLSSNNVIPALNNPGNTSGVFVNTAHPSVTLSTTAPTLVNTPFTATITFNEAVTGLAIADFTSNATLSNLQTADNITYTVLVTPAADGAVNIQLPANVVTNIAGNGNTASNSLSVTADLTAPMVTSVSVPANGYYKAGDNLDFTLNFSEMVRANPASFGGILLVTIGTTVVQAAYISGSNTNTFLFRYTVQNGEMDMDGITLGASLTLNGGTIQDVSGNNANLTLNNVGNTSGVLVNTAKPSVTLSTTAPAVVNAPFTVTVTFNEAVTGLVTTDFTITNATLSNLQTTNNITYTAQVTPTADGTVSIHLPADKAINIAGNNNNASNTLTVQADLTLPVIAAGQTFSVLQNSPAGTAVGTVTASDAAGTLQQWAITSDPSGGGFAINTNGAIRVNNTSLLTGHAGTTLTLMIKVSDGLNNSTPTPVQVNVIAVNQPPTLDPIPNAFICATPATQTIQLTGASAGEPAQTYSFTITADQPWFNTLSVNAAGVLSYQLKPDVSAGSTTITVTIKDNGGTANGGVDALQRSFRLTIKALPVISISSDKGTSVSKGDIVHLTATGGASYNWASASSIISGQQTAILEVRPQANTTYEVTATNAEGCSSTASIAIAVVEDFKIDATNILTPNGDGKNDRWVVRNIDSYPDNEVKIFDRAGRTVYQRRNYNNTWDGTVNGHPLAEGTYYYILTIGNKGKIAKGAITIIRDRY